MMTQVPAAPPEVSPRSLFATLLLCAICVVGILTSSTRAAADAPPSDRFDLLHYVDANQTRRPVTTPEDWQQRRQSILVAMQQVMGPFPDDDRRVFLDVKVVDEVREETYVRRLITYQSEPGSRTPAYLCIPHDVLAGQREAAAVLCLHPTDNTVGHKVVVGLGGREGRQYAVELAERGYVTLSPAYPHLANYWPNLSKLGYVSGTMKAIWDNSRGIDLLEQLPYVDTSNGVGAIGHSLGGHNAIYSACFEPRISVVASSCGFDSYRDYKDADVGVWYFGQGWCQIRYMPRLSNYRGRLDEIPYDFAELLGVVAPRPLFVNAPLEDSNFRWRSVDRCAAAARPIYELLGSGESLVIEHPDSDHNFPEAMRRQAYEMIDSTLQPNIEPKP